MNERIELYCDCLNVSISIKEKNRYEGTIPKSFKIHNPHYTSSFVGFKNQVNSLVEKKEIKENGKSFSTFRCKMCKFNVGFYNKSEKCYVYNEKMETKYRNLTNEYSEILCVNLPFLTPKDIKRLEHEKKNNKVKYKKLKEIKEVEKLIKDRLSEKKREMEEKIKNYEKQLKEEYDELCQKTNEKEKIIIFNVIDKLFEEEKKKKKKKDSGDKNKKLTIETKFKIDKKKPKEIQSFSSPSHIYEDAIFQFDDLDSSTDSTNKDEEEEDDEDESIDDYFVVRADNSTSKNVNINNNSPNLNKLKQKMTVASSLPINIEVKKKSVYNYDDNEMYQQFSYIDSYMDFKNEFFKKLKENKFKPKRNAKIKN